MKIVMVARDMGPSKAFQALKEEMIKRHHFLTHFLGSGESLTVSADEIRQVAGKVDVIVTGMSSSKELAEPELAGAEVALKAGVPVVCYADLFGTASRPFFMELWVKAGRVPHTLFVLDDFEKQDAEKKYPSSTKVIATGNPIIEEAYFPTWTREEARKKMEVADHDFVVLVPGGKNFKINSELFQSAVRSMYDVSSINPHSIKVFLATHPGDENVQNGKRPEAYFGLECVLKKASNDKRFSVKVLIKEDGLPTPNIVIGADGMISSMSTTGIDAAIHRVPVIDIVTPHALERFKEMSGGRTKWGPGEMRASYVLYDYDENKTEHAVALTKAVQYHFFGSKRNEMIQAQRKAYPSIKEPTVIKKMADALETIA